MQGRNGAKEEKNTYLVQVEGKTKPTSVVMLQACVRKKSCSKWRAELKFMHGVLEQIPELVHDIYRAISRQA